MANGTITAKINGRKISISGASTDPYFQNSQTHAAELSVYGKIATRLCPIDSVIIDVGANIGLSALTLNYALPRAKIHAIEPVPRTFRYLCQNLVAHANGNVTAHQLAISSAEGEVEFHESNDSSASHIVGQGHIVGDAFRNAPLKVRSMSLDVFVREQELHRIDFVKIDVEGFEIDVLKGMAGSILRFKPIVCMEFNSWTSIAFRNINPRDLFELFQRLMPNPYRINRDGTFLRLTQNNLMTFMHDNLVKHGCVDDLIGCADPNRLATL